MRAAARLVAEEGGLAVIESSPPLVLRATPTGVYVVAGAYTPLGGDDLWLDIEVGAGASLVVRSAAASVALPGPDGSPSRLRVTARVGAGGSLVWRPEPGVAAARCDHGHEAAVVLEPSASLLWREEVVLGRHGEAGGRWSSSLAVDLGGRPLLRHRVDLGAGTEWASPAVGAGARCSGSVLLVDPAWAAAGPPPPTVLGPGAAVMPLAGPAVLAVATGDDPVEVARLLDAVTRPAGRRRPTARRHPSLPRA